MEQIGYPGRNRPLELAAKRGRGGDQLLAARRAAGRFQQLDPGTGQHVIFSFGDPVDGLGIILIARQGHALLVRMRPVDPVEMMRPSEFRITILPENGCEDFRLGRGDLPGGAGEGPRLASAREHPCRIEQPGEAHVDPPTATGS